MTSGTRVIITAAAEQDVREILNYTLVQWGRPQRNTYFVELKRAVRRIQEFPGIGRLVDGDTREYALRHHVVLYRYDEDVVTVLRVMHPRRLRG